MTTTLALRMADFIDTEAEKEAKQSVANDMFAKALNKVLGGEDVLGFVRHWSQRAGCRSAITWISDIASNLSPVPRDNDGNRILSESEIHLLREALPDLKALAADDGTWLSRDQAYALQPWDSALKVAAEVRARGIWPAGRMPRAVEHWFISTEWRRYLAQHLLDDIVAGHGEVTDALAVVPQLLKENALSGHNWHETLKCSHSRGELLLALLCALFDKASAWTKADFRDLAAVRVRGEVKEEHIKPFVELALHWRQETNRVGKAIGDMYDWCLLVVRLTDYGMGRTDIDTAVRRARALIDRMAFVIQSGAVDADSVAAAVRACSQFWSLHQVHGIEVELLRDERTGSTSRVIEQLLSSGWR